MKRALTALYCQAAPRAGRPVAGCAAGGLPYNSGRGPMRILERSEFRDENGKISLQNRLRGSLRYGTAWYGIMQAQETVTETLNRSLSNDYHLLRNLLVPGTGLIASMILIGPPGVYALLASPASGVFRAKDEEWMSHSRGHFRPAP